MALHHLLPTLTPNHLLTGFLTMQNHVMIEEKSPLTEFLVLEEGHTKRRSGRDLTGECRGRQKRTEAIVTKDGDKTCGLNCFPPIVESDSSSKVACNLDIER